MNTKKIILALCAFAFLGACQRTTPEAPAESATNAPAASPATSANQVTLKDLAETVMTDNCDINSPAADATIGRAEKLPIWGYAFDKASWTVPANPVVRIQSADSDAKLILPLERGARDDVAKAFSKPEIANSGFGADVDVSSLAPGKYNISVLQEINGTYVVCNGHGPFTIK